MITSNIIFTGMPACGKSSIALYIANEINCNYFDLDEVIVTKENKSIDDIFSTMGENYFRQVEKNTLFDLFNKNEACFILSVGGGTIENNVKLLYENGFVIYLSDSKENIISNIKKSSKRPLFKNCDIEKKYDELFEKRKSLFEICDISYKKINNDIKYNAHNIIKLLKEKNIIK